MNCACEIVSNILEEKKDSKKSKWMIKKGKEINEQYLETGIDDEGLQLLADRSYTTLVIKDKIGKIWR